MENLQFTSILIGVLFGVFLSGYMAAQWRYQRHRDAKGRYAK